MSPRHRLTQRHTYIQRETLEHTVANIEVKICVNTPEIHAEDHRKARKIDAHIHRHEHNNARHT